MTKQQKLDRLKRSGYVVIEHPNMTMRFSAGIYLAKSIYNLHKQIFGY